MASPQNDRAIVGQFENYLRTIECKSQTAPNNHRDDEGWPIQSRKNTDQ
jgi:hypothetical protein